MGALGDQSAIFHQQDLVGAADLRQPVRDQQRGAALQDAAHGALDLILGVAVNRAGRVIQHQDARVAQKGACDRDALALAAREHHAALADHGVVTVRKAGDKLVRLGFLRGGLDLRLRHRLARAEGDIFGDRAREQEDILLNRGDLGAQAVHAPIAHIDTVDQHAPGTRIEGAVEQPRQRGFARAGLPDDRDRLPWAGAERDIA